MTYPSLVATILLMLCTIQPAHANLQINFIESAPKDSFVIKNIGECDLVNLKLEIDLSNSRGQLIFDTTAAGAGVEVFQPFEAKNGNLSLVSASSVSDGDKSLSVMVEQLLPNASASFTIDVDDTMPMSSLGQIRVTGSEVEGAQVSLSDNDSNFFQASFSRGKIATIQLPSCSSQ